MARRANKTADRTDRGSGAATLNILEWDEGQAEAPGWFGITITYRQQWQPTGHRETARLQLELPPEGGLANDESHF